MANQQHIEWLLEGVEAWNARRKREDFAPDFEGHDFTDVFSKNDIFDSDDIHHAGNFDGANLSRANFKNANLGGASLENASIRDANFRGANLIGANLASASLWGSDLSGADLRGAGFLKTSVRDVNFEKADVRTLLYSPETSPRELRKSVDLTRARSITQKQLESMIGDSETLIPEGLKRPRHWPVIEISGTEDQEDSSGTIHDLELQGVEAQTEITSPTLTEISSPNATSLRNQANFILQTANASQGSANLAALQIEKVIEKYCNDSGANGGDEVEILRSVATTFRQLASTIESSQSKDAKIQELQTMITQLEGEVTRLTEINKAGPSAAKQILIGSLQLAGGTAITMTASHVLGQINPDLINSLWQLISPTNATLSSPSSPSLG